MYPQEICRWLSCQLQNCISRELTHVLLNLEYPFFTNSVDPDQFASSDTFTFSMWIYINNLNREIKLTENWKWACHLNLFSMTRVKTNIFHSKGSHIESEFLGPVVQSVVSLTSSLRVISLTVLADSVHNILIFFAEKMWVAFALQKLLTFFQQKILAYLRITQYKF